MDNNDIKQLHEKAIAITDELYGEYRHITGLPENKLAACTQEQKQNIADTLNALQVAEKEDRANGVSPLVKGVLMATLHANDAWESIEHFYLKSFAHFLHQNKPALDALYLTGTLQQLLATMPTPIQEIPAFAPHVDQHATGYQKRWTIARLVQYNPDHPSLTETLIDMLRASTDRQITQDNAEIATYILSLASLENPTLHLPEHVKVFAPNKLT
jgi:hypothetical protein